MKKIAITGGIASGKTTVCRILKEHGASTLNSDTLIHQLLKDDITCIDQVKKLLGSGILSEGRIDRKKVAGIVFDDETKLKALEAILHPILLKRIDEIFKKVEKEGKAQWFVVELPLVQEINKDSEFDLVVAVLSPQDKSLRRFTQAGFSESTFHQRNHRQWDPIKKAEKADYVIYNDGTLEDLNHQVLEMMKEKLSQ